VDQITRASGQDTGAGVYFNVPDLRGQCTGLDKAKYAVIQHSSLCDELEDWKNLYLSGRLQKPVVTLVDCPRLQEARHKNCDMACATALLLLPERFDETELYATISAISYTGDPRMSFGEPHPQWKCCSSLRTFHALTMHGRDMWLYACARACCCAIEFARRAPGQGTADRRQSDRQLPALIHAQPHQAQPACVRRHPC